MDILIFQTSEVLTEPATLLKSRYDVKVAGTFSLQELPVNGSQPKLVFIDFSMPEDELLDAVAELRKLYRVEQTGLVVLSDREEIFAESLLLNMGADDFWVLPMQRQLFLARVNSRMRKYTASCCTPTSKENKCDLIRIDNDRYTVRIAEQEYGLSKKEFDLLQMFAAAPRKVFTRESIQQEVWGHKELTNSRTIDVHIKNLRNKIGDEVIATVKGVGYKLDCC